MTALLLVVAIACGGGEPPAPTPSPEISVARAQRLVKAGTLRAADLPGYRRTSRDSAGPDPGNGMWTETGATCLRGFETLASGDVMYEKGRVAFVSAAYAAPRAAILAGHLAYVAEDDTLDCLRRALVARLTDSDVTTTPRTVRRMRVPVRGAQGTYGIRIGLTAEGDLGGTVPLRIVLVGAATGTALVEIMALAAAAELPSTARLTALLTRAVARVRAAR